MYKKYLIKLVGGFCNKDERVLNMSGNMKLGEESEILLEDYCVEEQHSVEQHNVVIPLEEWETLKQEHREMASAVRALADLVEFLGEEVFRGRKAAIWRAMVEDVEAEHYGEFKDYLLGFDKKSKG